MSDVMTVSQLLQELKAHKSELRTVTNWKDMIPADSDWHPGDPGDPNCKICHGPGYLRMDFPIGHPRFGCVFLCDCAERMKQKRKMQMANAERAT